MNITVMHTLAPEVIEILKNFSRGIDPLQPVGVEKPVAKKEKQLAAAAASTTATASDNVDAQTSVAAEVEISTEVLRAKTASIIQSGKRAEVAALLTEFGVSKLVDLPKDKYSDFYKKVTAL